jgi:hypothetical protein
MAAACACAGAQAAGGHFAVDDASLLEAGCEQETWVSHFQRGTQLLHAGVNCRVGPIEFDGAGESSRSQGVGSTQWNLEAKWAHELDPSWSIGLDAQPFWSVQQDPHYVGTRSYAILTWKPDEHLQLNADAGRDWLRRDRDFARGGLSFEWQAFGAWTLVGERFVDTGTHYARLGTHWAGERGWSADLSYAQRLAGPARSSWSLGLTVPLRLR